MMASLTYLAVRRLVGPEGTYLGWFISAPRGFPLSVGEPKLVPMEDSGFQRAAGEGKHQGTSTFQIKSHSQAQS